MTPEPQRHVTVGRSHNQTGSDQSCDQEPEPVSNQSCDKEHEHVLMHTYFFFFFFFWKAFYFVVSYVLLSMKNNCLVAGDCQD